MGADDCLCNEGRSPSSRLRLQTSEKDEGLDGYRQPAFEQPFVVLRLSNLGVRLTPAVSTLIVDRQVIGLPLTAV